MEISVRLVLTNLPIEIDGKLYKVKIVPSPDMLNALCGRYALELEEIREEECYTPEQ